MSRRVLLAAVALLMVAPTVANAQFAITKYTVDAGGGTSSGGGFSLTGTIGQSDASPATTGGPFSLTGGFWGPESSSTGGYAAWAAANIPIGEDMSFAGDANQNGVPNGVEYAFGGAPIEYPDTGVLTAPADVPDDVELRLVFADTDLLTWITIATWTNGMPTNVDPAVTIVGGFATDSYRSTIGRGFWRYEAVLLP